MIINRLAFLFYIGRRSAFYFLFFINLFFWGQNAFAQTPRTSFSFKQLVDDKGTLANDFNCFLEDKDGFLWMATTDGLKRFDGNEFTIFKHEKGNPTSLIHSTVYNLCEDHLGRIWTGTEEGVGYFDKKTNKFYNFPELNKRDYVCLNLLCDAQGDVWFSIRDRGLFWYSEKTKKLQNFTFDPNNNASITSNRILRKSMEFDPRGKGIWLATLSGVNFFEFSTHQFYSNRNNPKKLPIFQIQNVSAIALDESYLIFFDADSHKLKYFGIKNEKITKEISVNSFYKKENIDITYIFVDKQHNLWLSAWNNTSYHFDVLTSKIDEFINDPANPVSIAANAFWCVYEQKDGNIWLGTKNGISITNPKNTFYEIFNLADLYQPLKKEGEIYLFTEDSADSTWWLATTMHSFLHYFPKANQLEIFAVPKTSKNLYPHIQALIEHQNSMYVVTTKSFHLFDKKTKKLSNLPLPDSLIKNNIIAHATQKGDEIWLFGKKLMAYSYHISTKKWTYFPVLVKSDNGTSYSAIDDNGNMWITIHAVGLAKFSKEKQAFEGIKTSNEVDFKKIGYSAMRKDSEGNFWIGSYDLIKFNPKTRDFSSALEINEIKDVMVDKEGKIWTTSFNDFTVFYPKTQKTITGTIPINKGDLSWTNHLFMLRNGQIISLMKGNIVKIDPTKLIPTSTKDKVLISKIALVDGEILLHNNASKVNLAATKNGFGIYFSTLNPPNEHKYKYNYQLVGYQNEWISTPNNAASFSNLDGGDYVFQVKGIDNNGYETPISTLNIHIETVFYKSHWFLYSCILAIGFLVYAFVRFRANQRSKIHFLQVQSTKLEKDKTEIQYQNLINHLNPHFLFNSLTSLNSLIMTEPKSASKFLQKLSLIYRYILQNKDKDVVSLEQELGFVKHYIDLQKSRFEDGLQINIDIKEEHLSCGIVPVTLQNLFENAIKHNTIEEDKPLIIKVLVENDCLIVKNNLQKKHFVETSNKQGLDSLKNLYKYLTDKPLETIETEELFVVKIPLL